MTSRNILNDSLFGEKRHAFELAHINILCSSRTGRSHIETEAVVCQEAGLAYHLVPAWSILGRKCPGAFMVSEIARGSAITCGLLPADAQTAEMLVSYLHAHREEGWCNAMIEECAQCGGQWVRLSGGEEVQG
jgi:hypothetical protein